MDANEGPRGMMRFEDVLAKVDVETIRQYPRTEALRGALAERMGIDAKSVLVTAGADDALDRCCRARLGPGNLAIVTTPTFEMIPRYVRAAGADLDEVPWLEGPFPICEVLGRIGERTAAIFIVTPNNPTGGIASESDLRQIAEAAPGALLIVDLAYTEFAEVDLTSTVLSIPNAVLVRTFSKAWGLAGLRVGWVAGQADMIGALMGVGNPYAVSGVSAAVALECLRSGASVMSAGVEQVRAERERLRIWLATRNIRSSPSQANFVLVEFGDAASVHRRLFDAGVSVRKFDIQPLRSWLRVTCPAGEEDFVRLLHALEMVICEVQP
ncbi:MAG: histidinol-phosphate aminotransferase family protein [Phycisphaeraceae bacterium]|nr:histidinol-phosphate aminotransferase family protein [Phycisphaeraceae bacterium]MCW5754108.1 histidinol-phosphate aminotransferase family protein [Phycisphaeraceae bacterium]